MELKKRRKRSLPLNQLLLVLLAHSLPLSSKDSPLTMLTTSLMKLTSAISSSLSTSRISGLTMDLGLTLLAMKESSGSFSRMSKASLKNKLTESRLSTNLVLVSSETPTLDPFRILEIEESTLRDHLPTLCSPVPLPFLLWLTFSEKRAIFTPMCAC